MIKNGYKKTSIGYIPLDWEVKKFKDITDILRCGLASTPKYVEDGVPFLSAQNVKNGKLNLDKYKCISNELHEKLTKNTKPQKNDILMTRVGNVGDAAIVDIDWEFSVYVSLTHIRMKEGYDSQFFTQLLNSSFIKRRSLQTQYKGGGVANLNVKVVEEFDMPIPPLKEQQKIAEILSSVDATIEKTEQVIAKTEEVKKGLMQQLLTKGISHTEFKQTELGEIPVQWQVKKLADLGEALIGLTYSPDNITDESGTLVLRSSNIRGNRLSFDDNVYVDLDIPKRCVVQKDDILICVRNGSKALIGKSALIDNETVGCSFGAFMSVYRSKYNRYIFQLFNTELFKKQIYSNLGATINQITSANLKSFKFPIPPKEEQDKIVEILESYDSRVKIEEDKIKNLNLIKQGLMQQLLTGKTRVKVD